MAIVKSHHFEPDQDVDIKIEASNTSVETKTANFERIATAEKDHNL